MKLLNSNIIQNEMLISEKEYEILKDFFADKESEKLAEEYNYENRLDSKHYRKTDYMQEGASLWIVIDEEQEIVYEIIIRKVSFEGLIKTFFYDDGIGYNDNLVGIYNHINEYGYILSIENWVEDGDKTINKILNVFDLIEYRMKDIKHEGRHILQSAINMFREELTRTLNISIIEYQTTEYIRDNPGISRYYSIELTNNIYELIRDIFMRKVKDKYLDEWFFASYSENEFQLRSNNEEHINIYLSKNNQKYTLDLAKYEDYEKGKYHDKEYNEFILPEKDTLIEIFEILKQSKYNGVEAYDFIPDLLINTIKTQIR